MLQNKIYQKYIVEILINFSIILLGLSVIALTIRAVNFLELIVENGYSLSTYFKFSFLNIFGLIPKFIPLSFFFSLFIFLRKHIKDNEFIILWTSGEKKIKIVNLFLLSSVLILILYILLSVFFTPYALNKSRQLLSSQSFTSFLPTVREQQFNDTFNTITFFVEKKVNNELESIVINEQGGNIFKKFSSGSSDINDTTIIAEKGIIEKQSIYLLNGRIITTKENKKDVIEGIDLIKFKEMKIDLSNFNTTVIKNPKLQETSTFVLISCLITGNLRNEICQKELKQEVLPILNRRLVLPLYLPVIALICSFLLFNKNKTLFKEIKIFIFSFLILVLTEIFIKYTGLNESVKIGYVITPFILFIFLYTFLSLKLKKDLY